MLKRRSAKTHVVHCVLENIGLQLSPAVQIDQMQSAAPGRALHRPCIFTNQCNRPPTNPPRAYFRSSPISACIFPATVSSPLVFGLPVFVLGAPT